MLIQTHDGKQFDVPEENLEGFLKDYNKAIGFDPNTLSPDPEVNPERGVNFGGGARAALQGITGIGSYADEAEAYARSRYKLPLQQAVEHLTGQKTLAQIREENKNRDLQAEVDADYDKYLKNARESYEGAKKNMPEVAYPLEIGTGIASEAGLAVLTGGASLHPAAQGRSGRAHV